MAGDDWREEEEEVVVEEEAMVCDAPATYFGESGDLEALRRSVRAYGPVPMRWDELRDVLDAGDRSDARCV
jgi:hypothetical protein